MKKSTLGHAIGFPLASVSCATDGLQQGTVSVLEPVSPFLQSTPYGSNSKPDRKDSVIHWMSRFSRKADHYVQGIREHVRLGPRICKTVKGKLSLTARIIQAGGVERVFRQLFAVEEGEKLLKASQCYLWTTAGPIAGMLFISTEKIAFHSDRTLRITSSEGDLVRVPYKVLIPLKRVSSAASSRNSSKPNQKYINIVMVDDFEFWFMGFVSYRKSFKYLQHAISGSQ